MQKANSSFIIAVAMLQKLIMNISGKVSEEKEMTKHPSVQTSEHPVLIYSTCILCLRMDLWWIPGIPQLERKNTTG